MTTISVVIGRFGVPNRNGRIFKIDEASLRSRLDELVGKTIGEVSQNEISQEMAQLGDFADAICRAETVDVSKGAGILTGYQIDRDQNNNLIVTGNVVPSPRLQNLLERDPNPTFGIRGVTRSLDSGQKAHEILKIISFDYLPPTER